MTHPRSPALACLLLLTCACGPEAPPPADEPPAEAPPAGRSVPPAQPSPDAAHSSRNSLDWAGTYSGVTPCADCPGIRTTVVLRADGGFERTMVYLERSVEPLVETGRFAWNAAGSAVTLQDPDGGGQQYKVGENTLIHLDRDGNPVPGDLAARYVLHKHLHDPAIEGVRWVLTALRGKPVDAAARGPFLVLDAETGTAGGNASCNSFSGPYAIKSGNRIGFGENLASTMMACPDMSTEQPFLDVLRSVDSYAVADGVLSLNRARMAPLATFEAAAE